MGDCGLRRLSLTWGFYDSFLSTYEEALRIYARKWDEVVQGKATGNYIQDREVIIAMMNETGCGCWVALHDSNNYY